MNLAIIPINKKNDLESIILSHNSNVQLYRKKIEEATDLGAKIQFYDFLDESEIFARIILDSMTYLTDDEKLKIQESITPYFQQFEDLLHYTGGPFYEKATQIYRTYFEKQEVVKSCLFPVFRVLLLKYSDRLFDTEISSEYEKIKGEVSNLQETVSNEVRRYSDSKGIFDAMADKAKENVNTFITEKLKSLSREVREVSNKEAIDIFKTANRNYLIKITTWSILTIAGVGLLGFYLYSHSIAEPIQYIVKPKDGNNTNYEVSLPLNFYSALFAKIAFVTLCGAVIGFFIKMLRSTIHLYESNQHRLRLVEGIGVFVNSAISDENQDEVLKKVISVIVDGFNTGLTDSAGSDNVTIASIATDTLKSIGKGQ